MINVSCECRDAINVYNLVTGEYSYKTFTTIPAAPIKPRPIKITADSVSLRWTFSKGDDYGDSDYDIHDDEYDSMYMMMMMMMMMMMIIILLGQVFFRGWRS